MSTRLTAGAFALLVAHGLAAHVSLAQIGTTISPPALLDSRAFGDGESDRDSSVAAGGDTWVAVWGSREDFGQGTGTEQDIRFSRSTDNGLTWTPSVTLNTNATFDVGWDSRPEVATDGAGTWIVVWDSADDLTSLGVGLDLGTDPDVLFARSIDDGLTWSDPRPLKTNAHLDVTAWDE